MFCPNCGKADQSPSSYCRSCGQFLNDLTKHSAFSFGGDSLRENVNAINILSLIAAVISLITGVVMYATQFDSPLVLYFAAAILICNAGWHLSNFVVGKKLKKRLDQAKRKQEETKIELPTAKTRELLPGADFENRVPASIVEKNNEEIKN